MQHILNEVTLLQFETLFHCSSQIIVFRFFQERWDCFWLQVQGAAYIQCSLFNKMPQTSAPFTKTHIVLRWKVVMHEQRQLLIKVKRMQKLKYILFCW